MANTWPRSRSYEKIIATLLSARRDGRGRRSAANKLDSFGKRRAHITKTGHKITANYGHILIKPRARVLARPLPWQAVVTSGANCGHFDVSLSW